MAEITSVGAISLDLIIKEDFNHQLNKISQRVNKPAERIGKAIERCIEDPIKETSAKIESTLSEVIDKAVGNIEDAFKDNGIDEAIEKWRQHKALQMEAELNIPAPEPVELGKYIQYDSDEIMRQIEEPMNKSVEKIKEKLGTYEVPTDPVERLQQEINNSYFKLDLLQKKWQELSAADPTDKVCSQLQSVQQQIISTTSSIDKMEEKLAKSSGADKLSQLSSNYESRIRSIEEQNAAKIEQINARTAAMKERYEQQIVGMKEQNAAKIEQINARTAEMNERYERQIIALKEQNAAKTEQIAARTAAMKEKYEQQIVGLKEQNAAKIQEIESQSAAKIDALHQKNASKIQAEQAKIRSSVGKTSNAFTKLGKSIKNAAKSVFVMAGIYGLFRGIKSAVESAMSGNEEFSKSLNQVKANLNVAFTPIAQAVMPLLNRLMSGLASVTASVASFISGIFGTTYKQAAEAAKKLKGVSDTAKKAKMSTAGIDEMNILSSGSEDSSASSDDVDYSALGEGDKKAEELGAKVRKYLSEAFEYVGTKAKSIFQTLSEWAAVSFAPTFAGIWDGLKTETEQLREILSGIFNDICTLGEPLKEYFCGDFTQFLQTSFATAGEIAIGLFDIFNTVFSDIWNIAVFPALSNFITLGLPVITQFCTQLVKSFGVLFKNVKKIFDALWEDAAKPVLNFIADLWEDLMELIAEFWGKWGQPIFEKFNSAINKTGNILLKVWNTFLKPVFDKLMSTLDEIWKEHLKPLVANFLDFVGELISGALDIYNKFIAPLVSWFVEKFGPPIAAIFNWLIDTIGNVIKGIIDEVNGIITALKGVVQFISGVLTGDWKKAWQGIKNIFKGIWDTFDSIVKTPINLIIDLLNGLTGAVESALNWMIEKLNTLSFDIPSWVPGIGGNTFGFNFSTFDIPQIPHLAQGGLATAPTLAMVGDNRNAAVDPEVIAPLSKLSGILGDNSEIVELLKTIIELLKNGMDIEIINYLFRGSKEFSREVIKAVNSDNTRRGR